MLLGLAKDVAAALADPGGEIQRFRPAARPTGAGELGKESDLYARTQSDADRIDATARPR